MKTLNAAGTARGGQNDDGCIDHHFLGWLNAGDHFLLQV
jgi:hypothetical protein